MTKVIGGMTISLDGFVNDKNGSVGALYPEFEALAQSELMQTSIQRTGAVVMGRHTYEMAQDYSRYEFQVPIFVLTRHTPDTVAKGESDRLSFTFVHDGVVSAINQAKAAAAGKDVMVVGGANTLQQCLNAGLLDEFQLGIVPVLLGEGVKLFANLDMSRIRFEKVGEMALPGGRTDINLRVRKPSPS